MKRILLLLLLSYGAVFSQTLQGKFKDLNSEQLNEVLTNIVNLTNKNYTLKERNNIKVPYDIFTYKTENGDVFTIKTFYEFEGENKDLEIKGEQKWMVSSISGKFLDVFPFWKKYIDETAEPLKISEKGSARSDTDRFLRMYKVQNYDNFWILEL